MSNNPGSSTFYVELIKPSHYDKDGYVIQWWKSWIPSNSLAVLYGLSIDVAKRKALGPNVNFEISAYDETNTRIRTKRIINRFRKNNNRGLVCLVGVQSNQFPRAMAIGRELKAAGIQVAIGGFHAAGCISMLPELTPELQEAVDMGITLFAGEAEGRLEALFQDADAGRMNPIYNYLNDLPDMQGVPVPFLPEKHIRRYVKALGSFDAGRGCPFSCSFCTIINVQGHKSRFRNADEVEQIIRNHADQGIDSYFITDDNFARNKNWEEIFDRLAHLREKEGLGIYFIMQVDTLCHTIPNFVTKAQRAGCRFVYIGLENINPDSLKGVSKRQNKISEYRKMLQAWHDERITSYCGYILGFPTDTPETIEREIRIVQKELPVDILEFFILTPLPGSQDHKEMYLKGEWMDPDLNKYDLEYVVSNHPIMSREEWQDIYHRAWHIYYSWEHIETILKRAVAAGIYLPRLVSLIFEYYGSYRFESLHPLQAGIFRRKGRNERRPELERESVFVYYPRRVWDAVSTAVPASFFLVKLLLLWWKVSRDPENKHYLDIANTPVEEGHEDELELFEVAEAAKSAAAKAIEMKNSKQKAAEKALTEN
ncbi:MAG: radical SAM protein [Verrucomicrobia bacterium]|nr:radical SAM protein [Verrucomicrobiota bacterium]